MGYRFTKDAAFVWAMRRGAAPETDDPEFEQAFARNSGYSSRTHRYYIRLASRWTTFCATHGKADLPIDNRELYKFLDYLRYDEGRALPYLRKMLSATNALSHSNGIDRGHSPLLAAFFRDASRNYRADKATPFSPENILALARHAGKRRNPLKAARDRAFYLFGYAGAFRPMELLSLEPADLTRCRSGATVTINDSKANSSMTTVRITFAKDSANCPVRAIYQWMKLAGISEGPIFRSFTPTCHLREKAIAPRKLSKMIRADTAALGWLGHYTIYSLRRGFATFADRLGAPFAAIKGHLRHVLDKTTDGYIDRAPLDWRRVPTRFVFRALRTGRKATKHGRNHARRKDAPRTRQGKRRNR